MPNYDDVDHFAGSDREYEAHELAEEEARSKTTPYITVNKVNIVFCCAAMEEALRRDRTIRTYKWDSSVDPEDDESIVIYGQEIYKVTYCPFCGEKMSIVKESGPIDDVF